MNRDNESVSSMTAENVEQFEVRILNSGDLSAVVIPIDAPWNASEEIYALGDSTS
jgi:hypothetical protein